VAQSQLKIPPNTEYAGPIGNAGCIYHNTPCDLQY